MQRAHCTLLSCLFLILLFGITVVSATNDTVAVATTPTLHPPMRLDPSATEEGNRQSRTAPSVRVGEALASQAIRPTGSFSLLSSLPYVPAERDQGYANNCWVWASTGALEVEHTRHSSVKDRLSVQYFDSNFNGGSGPNWAGDHGGSVWDFVLFYAARQMAVPWSNYNANYQDGVPWCLQNQRAWVPASSIQTNPHYDISGIWLWFLSTDGVDQRTAIANIKSVLHRGQAVPMDFWLPDGAAWTDFNAFWWNQGETAVWDPSKYGGTASDGHVVVCVGYDDTDPTNRYWIMVNSWGTAGGKRPHGTFRMKMDLDYSKRYPTPWGRTILNTEWMEIEADFADEPLVADFVVSPNIGPDTLIPVIRDASTGYPTSWSWTFGDGRTSTSQNPGMMAFTQPGVYTITLTVRDAKGHTSSKSRTLEVQSESSTGDAVDAPALPWSLGIGSGDPLWYLERSVTHDSQDALQVSGMGDQERSRTLSTTVTGPATVSFWWKVSSEPNRDYLHLFVDGVETAKISGTVPWTKKQLSLGSGTHTLGWDYEKDGAYAEGEDTGWLDQVTVIYQVRAIPSSTAAPRDLNSDSLYEDVNGNGRKDFADIVLFFNQMSWVAANEPVPAFDYNANGRIDFADVVWLFNHL